MTGRTASPSPGGLPGTEGVPEGGIDRAGALALLQPGRRQELWRLAHHATEAFAPRAFDACAIVNARCGHCSEDCQWCAQSARWKTGCECFGWIGQDACVAAAREAAANGADRIGIVVSGRRSPPGEVDAVCEAVRAMRGETGLEVCASLGLLGEADLERLAAAGLSRVHCNLETAPSRFPRLCTTHTVEEKRATLRAAKAMGLAICCGGILGMGESAEEWVEFAFALKEIAPDSVPVNILHPIAGTPLSSMLRMDPARIVDAVAVLRLVLPATPLRFAGGRRDLDRDTAEKCLHVGICAGIAGPLLTTRGGDFDDDRALARRAGYAVSPRPVGPARQGAGGLPAAGLEEGVFHAFARERARRAVAGEDRAVAFE